MNGSINEKVTERVSALLGGGVVLQCQRDPQGIVHVPAAATLQLQLTFTIPELREAGIAVTILTADGRQMSDDEYVAAKMAELEQAKAQELEPVSRG